MLRVMWWFVESFDIRDLGNNTVMLLFADEDVLKCIHMQGPWSFDIYMVGLFHLGEAAWRILGLIQHPFGYIFMGYRLDV